MEVVGKGGEVGISAEVSSDSWSTTVISEVEEVELLVI
jgi:hypothetical protein